MSQARRILCIPYASVLGDARRNTGRILDLACAAAETGLSPDVVVLPELALSGYVLESLVAEAAVSEAEILSLAVDLTTTGLSAKTEWIVGLPLREGKDVYNVAVVLSGGKILHIQKKIFLPTYGMFDEARYFKRGNAFTAYDGVLGKSVILICEDAWHMEMAYAAAESGAESVIVISSSPARGYAGGAAAFDSTLTWQNRLKVFAESYGQNYIYCNRSGVEDGILYDGNNFVLDADARLCEAAPASIHDKANLYMLAHHSGRHAGFRGDSSRQNDLPLVREILRSLPGASGQ
jgi:NAD+ synthase (glutamine-hydrolysing)